MKNLLALTILLATFNLAFGKTVITGSVKGLKSAIVKVSYHHPITNQETTFTGEFEKGKFLIEFDIDEPKMANLFIDQERTSVYISPNQKLLVTVNYKEFDETLEYEGDFANENSFFKQYYLEFEDVGKDPTRNWYGELEAKEFQEKHNERLNSKLDFIKEFNETTTLSEDFMTSWINNEKYNVYGSFLYYPSIKSYYTKKSRTEVVRDGYYDFLAECDFSSDDLVKYPGYLFFLGQFINHKLAELQMPSHAGYDALNNFFLANMILTGKSRTAVQASYLSSSLSRIELAKLAPYWDDFLNDCDQDVALYLQGKYDRVIALQPGKKAPQFSLKDLDGKTVNLSDFKGKVVYIDFWASWCGPCIQQVPYAKEMQKKYEAEKDLVFLYISIDDEEKNWRKAVKEKELSGVHVWAQGFKHDTPQSYNVSGIPTYYLIGRDGNIYKNNAPRPSSGEVLEKLFEDALSK